MVLSVCCEPRRLWKRYFRNNPLFAFAFSANGPSQEIRAGMILVKNELDMAASCEYGCHIMKTTIEIADDFLSAPKNCPKREDHLSFTDGARLAFGAEAKAGASRQAPTVGHSPWHGLSAEFKTPHGTKSGMRSTGGAARDSG